MLQQKVQQPARKMHRKVKLRVTEQCLDEWAITALVCILNHFGKVANWLVRMDTKEQRDRLGHHFIPGL